MSVGFLGAGKMAQAMARGLLASGTVTRDRIFASDVDDRAAHLMKGLGVQMSKNNRDVVQATDVVVVAVKPSQVSLVLEEVSPVLTLNKLIVSVAAGVTLKAMEKNLPQKMRVARVMPNTPAIVRQGASAYSMGQNATPGDGKMVRQLMLAVGYAEEVKEKQIAAVTGLSGSGPAYCFMAIESLADGGVKAGLPRDVATKLAAHTLMGAAKLVLESDKHPGELKDNVCSPEGATIYAVNQLERAGLRGILMDAVEAAMKRTVELGNETK